MALQELIAEFDIGTALAPIPAAGFVTIQTGIQEYLLSKKPFLITPDRATALAVVGDPTDNGMVTFQNTGTQPEFARFFIWRIHTINGFTREPGVFWRGLGPNAGGGGSCNCCGKGAAPTSTPGTGAGGGAIVTLDPNSTNMAGTILIHTGDSPDPVASALICEIDFDPMTPFAAAPFPVICGTNEETEEHIDRIFVKQSATTPGKFEVWAGDVALEENEDYSINYVCLGSCTDKTPPGAAPAPGTAGPDTSRKPALAAKKTGGRK